MTTFRYKGRIMKLFNIRKVMVLVSVSIHEGRISCTFFGGLKASGRWKLKKLIILENIKSNELSLVFSKIVSKGLWCDKVWGISIFSSCTPIRGIYRNSLLIGLKPIRECYLHPTYFLPVSSMQAHTKDNARGKRAREERTRARGKSAILPFLHPFWTPYFFSCPCFSQFNTHVV